MNFTRKKSRGSSAEAKAAWRATYEKTPYDELPWFEEGPSRQVKLAVEERFLPPGGEVLDVGCGAGSNVLYLAKSGYRAHGVDLSPGAVAAARVRASESHVDVDIQEGDALALHFPNGGLDGVNDRGCFTTLPFSRRRDYAREIHRVLRPGGSFVLSWAAREWRGDPGPPHRPSLQEVSALFEPQFLFTRTGFYPPVGESGPSSYFGFLVRRNRAQPPRR